MNAKECRQEAKSARDVGMSITPRNSQDATTVASCYAQQASWEIAAQLAELNESLKHVLGNYSPTAIATIVKRVVEDTEFTVITRSA